MPLSRLIGCNLPAVLIFAGAVGTQAQGYPNKPVRIVASLPGGSIDFAARLLAQGLTGPLGQQVIVDNRPGNIVIGQTVLQAPADGYTLLIGGSSFWTGPLLQKTPYDVVMDFSPIVIVEKSPNILTVHPSLPVKSVRELILLAKAKPGQLNYGSSAIGASNHLSVELFKSMTSVNIVHINYKGGGPALTGLLSGEVQLMFASTSSVAPHTKSGKLRDLAVTSAHPSILAPGLPPIAATVPGYELVGASAVFGPAKTPAAVVQRLNQEITRVLNHADVKEKFLNAGSEVAPGPPEELAALVRSDITTLGKLIKDIGIKVE